MCTNNLFSCLLIRGGVELLHPLWSSSKLSIQVSSEINASKNEEYLKNNLELKDKILKLQNEKKILEDEKFKLDQEFDEINKKVEGLIDIIKNSYYE